VPWVRRQSALARGRPLTPYRWILDHRGAKRRDTPRGMSKEISTEDHGGAKRRDTPRTCSKEILCRRPAPRSPATAVPLHAVWGGIEPPSSPHTRSRGGIEPRSS